MQKDFELAVSELIAMYRGRTPKDDVVAALSRQGDLVAADDGWMDPAGQTTAGPTADEGQPEDPNAA